MAVEAAADDEGYWERIRRIVDYAPPPTPKQLVRLADLMRVGSGKPQGHVDTAA